MKRSLKVSSLLPGQEAFLKILTGNNKGKAFRLSSSKIVIGRSSKCDVIFKDDYLCSPEHACIYKKDSDYFIQSLDLNNLIKINNKPITKAKLEKGDKVDIGKTGLQFTLKKNTSSSLSASSTKLSRSAKPYGSSSASVSNKKKFNPARWILILLVLGGLVLFLSGEKVFEKEEDRLRTEEDIKIEVEALSEKNKENIKETTMNFKEKSAQAAFISGFRDYGKGYYKRALSFFKHCSMIDKKNPLCRRYELKSKSNIQRLIEEKIRTGNAYMEKKQYSACEAIFRSVQLTMSDTSSQRYKEVETKRKFCSIHLKNRI